MKNMTSNSGFRNMIALAIATAFCAGAVALPAVADNADAPAATVKYRHIDLSTEKGAKRLYDHIRYVAEQLCSPSDALAYRQAKSWNVCVVNAISDAVVKVNKPMLTAVYDSEKTMYSRTIRLASTGK